jgi:hypothetical protein
LISLLLYFFTGCTSTLLVDFGRFHGFYRCSWSPQTLGPQTVKRQQ